MANDGTTVASETLAHLTRRFERAGARSAGSGLGLAIVAAIVGKAGLTLALRSPRRGSDQGFEAVVLSERSVTSLTLDRDKSAPAGPAP